MRSLCFTLGLIAVATASNSTATKSVLVVGDSWGTVLAVGSGVDNQSFFDKKMIEHGCDFHAVSIAIPGTQATDWDHGALLATLVAEAVNHDYVWISLMGNDALDTMPECAASGKTAAQCGDILYASMLTHMGKIVEAIHLANPKAKVVGVGEQLLDSSSSCREALAIKHANLASTPPT
jgi:hypothetical protein